MGIGSGGTGRRGGGAAVSALPGRRGAGSGPAKGLPCLARRGGAASEGIKRHRQGKRRHGACRAWITSGGRTAKGGRAGNGPSLPQAGRHGAEREKGKGDGNGAAARGLCGTVERLRTMEKKSPARGGACDGADWPGLIQLAAAAEGLIATVPIYRSNGPSGAANPPANV